MTGRSATDDREFFYEGFSTPNGTIVPDDVFDVLAPRLSAAELRVLLYIIRRTFGFGKRADAISLKQLTDGITARDGRVLDHGTGLSRKGVIAGIKGLLDKGIINVQRRLDERGENHVNVYTLRFREGVVSGGNHPGYPATLPPVTAGTPQDSALQDSVGQQHGATPPPLPSAAGRLPSGVVVSGYGESVSKDPACGRPDLYEQMKDLGVHHHTAGKLLREHDHLLIERALEFVSARLQQGWTPQESVAAWLVAAIRGRYDLPDHAAATVERLAAEERRAQQQMLTEEVARQDRERAAGELQRQRAEKLVAMGIEQDVDEMWQEAQAILRARDRWSAAMAMSYLKHIENGLAVVLVPGNLRKRLLPWEGDLAEAIGEVVGGPVRLILHEMG